jgi:hypothetical protein
MTMSFLRRASAGLLLLTLLVGLPALLVGVVGIPTSLPSGDSVWLRLTHPDDGTLLVAVTTSLAWIGWVGFAASVGVETAARIRGLPTPKLPALGSSQRLAATLIAAVSLSVIAPAVVHVERATAAPVSVAWGSASASIPGTAALPAAPDLPTVIVQRGDTLWDLAERHLGDPLRYTEIAELNYHRAQADGRSLTDAHWIYPGWVLLLPTSGASAPAAPASISSQPQPIPSPAEHSSSTSTLAPEVAPPATPAATGEAPTASTSRSSSDQNSGISIPSTAYAGMGILSVGLLAEVARRRRRREQRSPGQALRPLTGCALTELRLRSVAEQQEVTALRVIIDQVGADTSGQGEAPGDRLLALHLNASSLRLTFTAPVDLPAPWIGPVAGGHVWELDPAGRSALIESAQGQEVSRSLPGLVTVGRRDDGTLVLLNLLSLGLNDLHATPDELWCQLDTMALELAATPWCGGWFHIATVGLPSVTEFDRITTYGSITEVTAELRGQVGAARSALVELGFASLYAAQLAGVDDDRLIPTVGVLAVAPTVMERATLLDLVDQVPGLVGLIIPNHDPTNEPMRSGSRISYLRPDRIDLSCLSREGTLVLTERLSPSLLDREERRDIDDLFASVVAASEVEPDPVADTGMLGELDLISEPEQPALELESGEDELPEDEGEAAPHGEPLVLTERTEPLQVRILGPVDVVGLVKPLSGPRLLELLLLTALRGEEGLRTGLAMQALSPGPDTTITAGYRSRLASLLRQSLGNASDGSPILQTSRGMYRLHPELTLDWDRFVALANDGTTESLHKALALVRGEPLDGVDYWWLPEHGVAENRIRAAVTNCAEKLVTLELEGGNHEAAVDAAYAGLRMGTDERLYRLLMRAHHEEGNRAGVEQAMRECMAGLKAIDLDEPHPDTLRTYRQLTSGSVPVHA